MPLYYSGNNVSTLSLIPGHFFHITSSVTFQTKHEHSHPNVQQCAVEQRLANTITDFTNSARGKVKHYFIALRTKSRRPPETSASSITHSWFYKASTSGDFIWLYYNGHQRRCAINQIEEGKSKQLPSKAKKWTEMAAVLCFCLRNWEREIVP